MIWGRRRNAWNWAARGLTNDLFKESRDLNVLDTCSGWASVNDSWPQTKMTWRLIFFADLTCSYITSLSLQPLWATASHEMPTLLQRNKLPGHVNLMPTPGQSLTAPRGLSALPCPSPRPLPLLPAKWPALFYGAGRLGRGMASPEKTSDF